ncbi:MAG: DUF58 domain-containing protein [Acidiferrobacterales bacterium]|nr:DUF58 domain-containing protein [Acidiferrobacterales bacterium]
MANTTKQADLKLAEQYAKHGIVTDLARLLRSRHWAQNLKLFSRQAARSMLLGNVRSRFRGRGMEFEEVRRYQAGDDIRTIDWKVSARVGKTYTKLFCEERERPCHILVDQRSNLYFGSQRQFKSVLAAELAAGLSWAALAGGDRVGGQVIGDFAERDSRGRRSKQAVLRFIHDIDELNRALMQPELLNGDLSQSKSHSSLANSLEECRRITRPGTAIFVISDFHDFDADSAKALSNLGKHADLTLLHVVDELEEELPFNGSIAISDGEHKAHVNVSNKIKSAYHSRLQEKDAALKSGATKARALYKKIDTSQSAREALIAIFGK